MLSKNKTALSNNAELKKYAGKVKKAGEMADRALKQYGEPTISLSALRAELSRHLRDRSLSDIILKDREEKW